MNRNEPFLRPDARGVERLALSVSEVARSLGCSERHLQAQIKKGAIDIPSVRLGRLRLFPVDAVRDWLQREARSS
ncbi:MAG: helix-turn-helix domain-containing protein [Planctomycetes bacterium]|nr:helix-turn-helix domain-containing protein [Planctomycetota bacterium]